METTILTLTVSEIQELVASLGQPAFRSKQLLEWLYVHHAADYDQMTNLPKAFREQLREVAPLVSPVVYDVRQSIDGTKKYLFRLGNGDLVEAVAIPQHASHDRLTVCFSTQVGCAMNCAFCATGHEGFTRNLGPGEMVSQILAIQDDFGTRVTNLVGMGQGEPFLNYNNVLDALHILNDPKRIAIGARHIVISTCGIIPGIRKFSSEKEQFTLAVSLHSAVQATRDSLMPMVKKYPLEDLKKALIDYVSATSRRVSFEYLLMDGVNDSDSDLRALEEFCSGILCHINFLPMNAVDGSPFQPSSEKTVRRFLDYFNSHGIESTLRTSRGSDIDGACGQLKNSVLHA